MKNRREELLTVRIEPKLKENLRRLERERIETRSNIVREALYKYLQKQREMTAVKKFVAKKFTEGEISFERVVELLGYDEAKKIAFFVEKVKKAFKGLK